MAEDQGQQPRSEAYVPYFVVEVVAEGGPKLFTEGDRKREAVRSMFAVLELNDLDKTTLWRTAGPRGLQVQALAMAFMHNPGLFEAVGAMMDLMANDKKRNAREDD